MATAVIPPLPIALLVGGLAIAGSSTTFIRHAGRWIAALATIVCLAVVVVARGSVTVGSLLEPAPPFPGLELAPVTSFDPPPVAFAYAPEALDRLPVLQDTAALLAAAAPLSYEDVLNGEETEFQLRFVLDSSGLVDLETVQLRPSPSFYGIDMFRARLAPVRFHPGELGGRPVRTEMRVPLRKVEGTVSPQLARASWNPVTDGAATPSGPALDPWVPDVADAEIKPRLTNAEEVQAQLAERYPPLLRDAGISGQTVMSFVIDEQGGVDRRSIVVVSTTHEGFAQASAAVVSRMRFSTATVLGRTAAVRMQIPISWTLEPD